MNVFALDVETTTSNKGDPFDERNRFVLGGYGTDRDYGNFTTSDLSRPQVLLDNAKMVVLFNAKFDLHWCRRIGLTFNIRLPIWDCQLAEFILSNQRWKYPSLEEACSKRGLGHKVDIIKQKYWDNGINTDEIPFEELNTYLKQDINLTYLLYLEQIKEFKKPEHASKYKVFRLQCYDLLVLEEMEYNGYKFDVKAAREEASRLEKESTRIQSDITSMFVDVPINLSSPDHISCILYGGTIVDSVSVPVGVYKTGLRAGEPKYKKVNQEYILPRLVEPIRGTELKKDGYFATNEDVLKNLRADGNTKKIIDSLLERRGLEKLQGTYYNGIPNLIETHCWANDMVHGQFNQCVALTGRLSATKPNQQNMPGGCKKFCVSRYE